MATIIKKFRIYGPKNFLRFSLIELYRQFNRLFRKSYSQHGEDLLIKKYASFKVKSFVDVGSNHPQRFNNTYHFYLQGAQGVNLDPNRDLIRLFKQSRPGDISLSLGLGDKSTQKIFYQLDPDVDSSFDLVHIQGRIKAGCTLVKKYPLKITTLKNIFTKYFPKKSVDLLNIDTEGYDYQILLGNDWSKYRPQIICIEDRSRKTQKFLKIKGYCLIATTPLNSIYVFQK